MIQILLSFSLKKPLKFALIIFLKTVTLLLFEKKGEFKEQRSSETKESYFIFNNILYKQIDGEAMGLQLGPSLALLAMNKIG